MRRFLRNFVTAIIAAAAVLSLSTTVKAMDILSATPKVVSEGFEFDEVNLFKINKSIDELNITLDFDVVAGRNYIVTVNYTAKPKIDAPLNIRYALVSEDECTPNVVATDDRSGLLNEPLTAGEKGYRTFEFAAIDDTVTIKIAGSVIVDSVEFKRIAPYSAGEKRTVFLVGDSQLKENVPRVGWAQKINEYFTDDVFFDNRAIGARSTGSYIRQGRWNDVLMDVKPGDYVFVDFGHNDGGGVPGRSVEVKDYKAFLMHEYIDGVRLRGGIPVIVSIGNRNNVNIQTGAVAQTLPDYVNAAMEAAYEKDALFINLNELSSEYLAHIYNTFGRNATNFLYVDGTHYSDTGAYRFAGIVAEEIVRQGLEGIAEYYVAPSYDATRVYTPTSVSLTYEGNLSTVTWEASEGAVFYIVERAVICNGVLSEDFTPWGSSLETTFLDSQAYRTNFKGDETYDYLYRIIACNDYAHTESTYMLSQPSDYCSTLEGFVYEDPNKVSTKVTEETDMKSSEENENEEINEEEMNNAAMPSEVFFSNTVATIFIIGGILIVLVGALFIIRHNMRKNK